MLLTGIGIFVYPAVSREMLAHRNIRTIISYRALSDKAENVDALLADAQEYNARIAEYRSDSSADPNIGLEGYENTLAPFGGDIIGYISIEDIQISLPIFHGTEKSELRVGAGHLAGTSLPVGGKGTHSCIAGHTGLYGAELFDKLDRMSPGDEFTLTVLGKTLRYRVIRKRVVEPDDFSPLAIEPEQDLCTLMTCTPYGVNSHRLLVTGERVPDK